MAITEKVAVIIPALNEEETIGKVVAAIPDFVGPILVVDNEYSDQTAAVAAAAGAMVLLEPNRGYGNACLKAMAHLEQARVDDPPRAVVFLDGDFSDDPTEMEALIRPILEQDYDMVIGSRVTGACETGALTTTQRFGNWLSCQLIKRLYGVSFTDLGPFRALKWRALLDMKMDDPAYGWTVQMQVRAALMKMKITEVPVRYRNRAGGKSKVSGTLKGVVGAGTTILYVIFKEAVTKAVR